MGNASLCAALCVALLSGLVSGQSCTPCPAGTSTLQYNSGSIPPQQTGQQNGKCNSCPTGYYSTRNGAQQCTACPLGQVTMTGGFIKIGSTFQGDCQLPPNPVSCLPGQFLNQLTSRCQACPIGTWRGGGCALITSCCACNPGTTTATTGQSSSFGCALSAPLARPTASPTVLSCPLGQNPFLSPRGGSMSCRPCDFGFYGLYDQVNRVNTCMPCPSGMTTARNGATDMSACSLTDCPFGQTMIRTSSNTMSSAATAKQGSAALYAALGVAIFAGIAGAGLAYYCYYEGKRKKAREMEEEWDHEQQGGDWDGHGHGHGYDGEDGYYEGEEGGDPEHSVRIGSVVGGHHGHEHRTSDLTDYSDMGGGGGGGGEAWEQDAAFAQAPVGHHRQHHHQQHHSSASVSQSISPSINQSNQRRLPPNGHGQGQKHAPSPPAASASASAAHAYDHEDSNPMHRLREALARKASLSVAHSPPAPPQPHAPSPPQPPRSPSSPGANKFAMGEDQVAAAARRMSQRLGVGAPKKNSLASPSSAVVGNAAPLPPGAAAAVAAAARRMSTAQTGALTAGAAAAAAARAQKDADDAAVLAPPGGSPRRSLAAGRKLGPG